MKINNNLILGSISLLLSILIGLRIWGIIDSKQVDGINCVELIIAIDNGDPQITITPNLEDRSGVVQVFVYRTNSVKDEDCKNIVIAADSRITNAKWKPLEIGNIESDDISVSPIKTNSSYFIDFDVSNFGLGIFEFTIDDIVSESSKYDYSVDLTFGHYYHEKLPENIVDKLSSFAPNNIILLLDTVNGYDYKNGFPSPKGIQYFDSKEPQYLYQLPYVFSKDKNRSSNYHKYYEQSDIHAVFENNSEISKKDWKLFLYSTFFGIIVSISVQSFLQFFNRKNENQLENTENQVSEE